MTWVSVSMTLYCSTSAGFIVVIIISTGRRSSAERFAEHGDLIDGEVGKQFQVRDQLPAGHQSEVEGSAVALDGHVEALRLSHRRHGIIVLELGRAQVHRLARPR